MKEPKSTVYQYGNCAKPQGFRADKTLLSPSLSPSFPHSVAVTHRHHLFIPSLLSPLFPPSSSSHKFVLNMRRFSPEMSEEGPESGRVSGEERLPHFEGSHFPPRRRPTRDQEVDLCVSNDWRLTRRRRRRRRRKGALGLLITKQGKVASPIKEGMYLQIHVSFDFRGRE